MGPDPTPLNPPELRIQTKLGPPFVDRVDLASTTLWDPLALGEMDVPVWRNPKGRFEPQTALMKAAPPRAGAAPNQTSTQQSRSTQQRQITSAAPRGVLAPWQGGVAAFQGWRTELTPAGSRPAAWP